MSREEVLEHALSESKVDFLISERRERGDSSEGTFKFTDVVRDKTGDEGKDIEGDGLRGKVSVSLENGEPCLNVGRLDICK